MRTSDLEARERKGIQVAKFLDQQVYASKVNTWMKQRSYYHWVRKFDQTSPFEGCEIEIEVDQHKYYLHEHICPYDSEMAFLLPIYAIQKKRGLKKEHYSFLLELDEYNEDVDFFCFYQEQKGEIIGIEGFFIYRKHLQQFLLEKGITPEKIYQAIKQGKKWKQDTIWTLYCEEEGIWSQGYLYAAPSLRSQMIFLGLKKELLQELSMDTLSLLEPNIFTEKESEKSKRK